MIKSSRHSKIAGNFGEDFILYWLSKNGFESVKLDHTGIDILSYHLETKRRWGISVKTRTRDYGKENEGVNIKTDEIKKIHAACVAFAAEPFVGIVLDRLNTIELFIISLENVIKINHQGQSIINIKVNDKYLENYKSLSDVVFVKIDYTEKIVITDK